MKVAKVAAYGLKTPKKHKENKEIIDRKGRRERLGRGRGQRGRKAPSSSLEAKVF